MRDKRENSKLQLRERLKAELDAPNVKKIIILPCRNRLYISM